jgi:hypothetical protein
MAKVTINKLLVLQKTVRQRIASLERLRSEVSKNERYFGREEKLVEANYDVKAVDKKITELEAFMFDVDSKIKESNATVTVDLEFNVSELLEPIQ